MATRCDRSPVPSLRLIRARWLFTVSGGEGQLLGDPLVRPAVGNQGQDLDLPVGQPFDLPVGLARRSGGMATQDAAGAGVDGGDDRFGVGGRRQRDHPLPTGLPQIVDQPDRAVAEAHADQGDLTADPTPDHVLHTGDGVGLDHLTDPAAGQLRGQRLPGEQLRIGDQDSGPHRNGAAGPGPIRCGPGSLTGKRARPAPGLGRQRHRIVGHQPIGRSVRRRIHLRPPLPVGTVAVHGVQVPEPGRLLKPDSSELTLTARGAGCRPAGL